MDISGLAGVDRGFRLEEALTGKIGGAITVRDPWAGLVESPCSEVFLIRRAFTRRFCARLLRALDRADSAPPNSMNRYGVVLREVGLGPLCETLLRRFVSPLAQRFYPEVGKLRDYHGFIVRYTPQSQPSLDIHRDESDITLNVCLGKTFTGGRLVFRANDNYLMAKVDHEVGSALLHNGDHLHQAQNVRSGERVNLILWCRT